MNAITKTICELFTSSSSLIHLANGNKASVSLSLKPELNQAISEFY